MEVQSGGEAGMSNREVKPREEIVVRNRKMNRDTKSGGDIGRRQARGQPPRGRDHTYRAATRNRRERGRVCWSGWSTWWSERMPCSSAAPWGPLDAPGRGPKSTENGPLCGGCESKVRGRRQPQNSRELAPMGWWTRPYAQTLVVWAFFACSTAPEYLRIRRYFTERKWS